MLKEWSDDMEPRQAAQHWEDQSQRKIFERLDLIERELSEQIQRVEKLPEGFYEAMEHFLAFRAKLFPSFSPDPAWRIMVVIANTPEGSGRDCATSISVGAEVPLTTTLRYISMMEAEGIVQRLPHPTDGRQSIIRLTPEGRRRLDAIASRWRARLAWMLALPASVFSSLMLLMS